MVAAKQNYMGISMINLSVLTNKQNVLTRPRPARTGKLAVLPVFHKLSNQKVVLVGGTAAAAWKGELLAATGAKVHIYAAKLCQEFQAIVAAEPAAFVVHLSKWDPTCFDNARLAVGDLHTDTEAAEFYDAAVAAGVLVNLIDRPAFCQFQFGSIVNRSPAIVSISTDGAAPILGQAIRRRIEVLLPAELSKWAQLAADIRTDISARLGCGSLRRMFWEKLAEQAFNSKVKPNTAQDLKNFAKTLANVNPRGHVTLVGAGPGNAELLTLKAVRVLQAADIILYDDLVSDEVLEMARREAKRILVGKRGGRISSKQDDINALMLKYATAGKNVVRLKAGDPSIFGRAGEEIEFLENHNVPVLVVPGITSALAMAAELGVSLTHRDSAQTVQFITGHSRFGELPKKLNWDSLAHPSTTSIFYMGGRTASNIKSKLIEHGMSQQTPVTVCSSVSRTNTTKWLGTLSELEIGMQSFDNNNPVIIGIGEVFADRDARVDSVLSPALTASV